ncbi:MAG: hypothetical protein HRT68_05965 [Flavobacteriaceae bacterium]|nr:hypothetical protein [Flavobacteriaceae bacterium]
MQLLKSRNFGDYFNDTFNFLKLNGKHLFKNYLIINGVITILIVLLFSSFSLIFIGESMADFEENFDAEFRHMFANNAGLLLLWFFGVFIIVMLLNIVSYSFFPVYLELYNKNNSTDFTTKDVVDGIAKKFSKGIKYMLGMILIGLPLVIGLALAILITICTLIGIYIPIAFFSLLVYFTLFEYYFNDENRFFDSFGKAWSLITSKFWPTVGCTAIIMFGIMIIQQIFDAVFQLSTLSTNLSFEPTTAPEDVWNIIGPQFLAIFGTAMIVYSIFYFITNLFSYLNMGIIYYSLKEENEHLADAGNEIDEIGNFEA